MALSKLKKEDMNPLWATPKTTGMQENFSQSYMMHTVFIHLQLKLRQASLVLYILAHCQNELKLKQVSI